MNKKEEKTLSNIPKLALGIRLLNSVREKKYKEVDNLLQYEPDLTAKDAAGWQAIHFAALDGSVEIIELLLKSGAVVECWDNNGQSPLHKAARRGHIVAVVALVAHGAAFPLDWKGQSPLELAVMEKHLDVVEVLCLCGAVVPPEDWSYVTEDKSAKMKQIKEILKIQRSLLPDFEYRKIIWKIKKVEKEETEIPELDLTVTSKDISTHFYLYIAQKTEFTEFISYVNILREEHELFSDLYECRVWKTAERSLNLRIKIDGVPGLLHDLVILSKEHGAARISSFNIENQQTNINVAITIRPMKKVTFAVLLKEKQPEVFKVSRQSTIITPEAEPESKITIPEGTFEEPAELQVEFVETKYVNEEEVDGPILLTNVLDITVSEGSNFSSGKELTMKLPIHEKNDNAKDIVVLVTSEEYPECVDDWEVIEAQSNTEDGSAVFKVSHLSIFVGAPKDKVKKNKAEVVDAAHRCLGNKCRAVFIGYTRFDDNVMTIVIECSTPKKAEKREKKWQKKGFTELFPKTDTFLISVMEIFRLDFKLGLNLEDLTGSSHSILQFQRKKEDKTKHNYIIKDFHIIDKTADINGEIKVDIEERSEVELVEAGCVLIKKKKSANTTTTKITYDHLTNLTFDFSSFFIGKILAEKLKKNAQSKMDKVSVVKVTEKESDSDIKQSASKDNIPQAEKPEFDADTKQPTSEDNNPQAEKPEFDVETKQPTSKDDIPQAEKPDFDVETKQPTSKDNILQAEKPEFDADTKQSTSKDNIPQAEKPEFDTDTKQSKSKDNIPPAEKPKFDADTNTIPALRWSSLKELASALSADEAEHIAIQLNLKRSDVEELQSSMNKQYGMAFLVFKHWRETTQSVMRVKKLQESLIAIGRQDLAIAFRQAHIDDVPFRKDDVGVKRKFRLS